VQVHEHTSELGRWRAAQRDAHPRLRAFVWGYFASSSFLPKPVRERHLPSAEIPLFLNFGAPHRRLGAEEPRNWVNHDGAWIVGLHDSHRLCEAIGERDFMIVRFTPLGAHHFLRAPMQQIEGQAVELSALDPKLADLVMSRVGAAANWDDRFAAMEALIAERVAQAAATPSGLAWAWRRLEAADGRVPLGALAAEVECSHRALIAQFRTQIGVAPKAAGRLLRFNRAIRSLNELSRNRGGEPAGKPYIESRAPDDLSAPAVDWVDMAADCGYFDQSHFIKEFRQFAGATPTEFLRGMADLG
jgi:AraC-like DNA-binding protein